MLVDKNEIHKLIKEKKVTNSIELNDVLRAIAKGVIETMYDGELTELLGYPKAASLQQATPGTAKGQKR
jgi:hypothetical protein